MRRLLPLVMRPRLVGMLVGAAVWHWLVGAESSARFHRGWRSIHDGQSADTGRCWIGGLAPEALERSNKEHVNRRREEGGCKITNV